MIFSHSIDSPSPQRRSGRLRWHEGPISRESSPLMYQRFKPQGKLDINPNLDALHEGSLTRMPVPTWC